MGERRPWHVPRPCADCPFLREGGIRLGLERIDEVIHKSDPFWCHKTCHYDDEDELQEHRAQTCAGWLIMREKLGDPSQLMRIAERLNQDGCGYDPEAVMKFADLVFDDQQEMEETAI